MRTLLALIACILSTVVLTGQSHAATVTGTLLDADTSEPVVGAGVYILDRRYGSMTGLDGSFVIRDVPEGTHVITISHIGYAVQKSPVTLGTTPTRLEVHLAPKILAGQDIVVTANRARLRETPVTFSNLSREDLRETYYAQDAPMILQTMPSTLAYSDAGNGIGYSYLKIRGFDQKRINVLVNGIPHNGPTSHEVYWIDMPDLLANAEDIQVQRGAGSSLYGSSSIGGTVNVITSNFSNERNISVYTGAGSYNTRKFSFAFNSGLVDDSYVMYGRFSRITTDGYRDQSWTKLWSYFFGIARYDVDMTTKVIVYGGPEQTHLSYYGIPKTLLEGPDRRETRKTNPLSYRDELDNFNQPHYELHHDWDLIEGINLHNTVYTIKGHGWYDQYRTGRSLSEFRLPSVKTRDAGLFPVGWYDTDDNGVPTADTEGFYAVERSDLIKSRWVDNDEYGWLPRVTFSHTKGTLTVGGEVRIHRGIHWGNISWLAAAPTEPDLVYYSYREHKQTFSAYAQELYRITPDLTLMADMQAVVHTYELDRDTVTNLTHETTFKWVSPRVGVNWNITKRLHAFANLAWATREPTSSDLMNPQDVWDEPKFATRDTLGDGTVRFSDPTVEPEELINLETGVGFQSQSFSVMLNLYYMSFRNEIVPWAGQISEASGLPVTGNAKRSVHQGIEIEASLRPFGLIHTRVPGNFLELSGNLNINDDHFEDYTEHLTDWNTYQPVSIVRDGNRIAGFPSIIVNGSATLKWRGASAGMNVRHVGRQYLDNSESRTSSIDPYTATDLVLGYRLGKSFGLKGVEISLMVNNIFDTLYESAGYMDDVEASSSTGTVTGTPYYIPAATRNIFISARFDL